MLELIQLCVGKISKKKKEFEKLCEFIAIETMNQTFEKAVRANIFFSCVKLHNKQNGIDGT